MERVGLADHFCRSVATIDPQVVQFVDAPGSTWFSTGRRSGIIEFKFYASPVRFNAYNGGRSGFKGGQDGRTRPSSWSVSTGSMGARWCRVCRSTLFWSTSTRAVTTGGASVREALRRIPAHRHSTCGGKFAVEGSDAIAQGQLYQVLERPRGDPERPVGEHEMSNTTMSSDE